jgi:hypothetical protein
MSDPKLDRVREDLQVMKQALGLHSPVERAHVWINLGLAAAGTFVATLTAFTNVAAVPATPGWPSHVAYLALLVVPVLLAFTGLAVAAQRRKAHAPLLWRESRQAAISAVVAVPLYLGFLAWAARHGVSPGALTAATLFLAGLFALLRALSEPACKFALGWAVATLLAGACAPLAAYQSAGILVGGWLLLGGLSTAAILSWQLWQGSAANAG